MSNSHCTKLSLIWNEVRSMKPQVRTELIKNETHKRIDMNSWKWVYT